MTEKLGFVWEDFINEPSWNLNHTRIAKYSAWHQVLCFVMDIAFEDCLLDFLDPDEADYVYMADTELRTPEGGPKSNALENATIYLE